MSETTLKEAVLAARAMEAKYGLPAAVMVAQWAVESGWGKHSPGNNCFGIKAKAGSLDRQLLWTREWLNDQELRDFLARSQGRTAAPTGQSNAKRKEYRVQDWFATYLTLEECFEARAKLALRPIYKPYLDQFCADGDIEKFCRGFGSKYATDPGYASTLMKVIAMPKVQAALEEVKSPPVAPAVQST